LRRFARRARPRFRRLKSFVFSRRGVDSFNRPIKRQNSNQRFQPTSEKPETARSFARRGSQESQIRKSKEARSVKSGNRQVRRGGWLAINGSPNRQKRKSEQEKKKEFLPPLSATWKKCRCETGGDLACTCTSRLRSRPTLMVDHPGQIFREKLSTCIIARAFAIFKRSPTFFLIFSRFFPKIVFFSRPTFRPVCPFYAPRLFSPISTPFRSRRSLERSVFRFSVGAKDSRRNDRRRVASADFRTVPKRGERVRRPFRATPAARELPLPRRIRESTR